MAPCPANKLAAALLAVSELVVLLLTLFVPDEVSVLKIELAKLLNWLVGMTVTVLVMVVALPKAFTRLLCWAGDSSEKAEEMKEEMAEETLIEDWAKAAVARTATSRMKAMVFMRASGLVVLIAVLC